MKITYSGKQKKQDEMEFELQRAKANEGCNVCPECGETREYREKWFSSKKYGIKKAPFPKYVHLTSAISDAICGATDTYHCYSCGCEYESELYKTESYYKAHSQKRR